MTKEKLRRLVELGWSIAVDGVTYNRDQRVEYETLLAAFEDWEPDKIAQERDENFDLASRSMERESRYLRAVLATRTELNLARKLARKYRRVLLENYGDLAVQALFAEDDCYYEWLRDDTRPQEVAADDD